LPRRGSRKSTIGCVIVAVTVCIAIGLLVAVASQPIAVRLCHIDRRVDESWIPVVRFVVALVGTSLAILGAVLLLGRVR